MLNILTVNLRFDSEHDGVFRWSNRRTSMQRVISDCVPDIVATQEGRRPQIQDLQSLIADYELIDSHRDWIESRMYPCLFVRRGRFTVADSGDAWLSDTPEVSESQLGDSNYPRLISWARLYDTKDDLRLIVANSHLDNAGSDVRRRQMTIAAEQLKAVSDGLPLVLCGDFNDAPDSDVAGVLTASLPQLYDPWLLSRREERSTFRGFSRDRYAGKAPEFVAPRIDWILLDRRLSFERIRRVEDEPDGIPPTDHYPVLCSGIRSDFSTTTALSFGEPLVWHNPSILKETGNASADEARCDGCPLDLSQLETATRRMRRYEALLPDIFPELRGRQDRSGPETETYGGLRSPLRELSRSRWGDKRVFGKCDNELPVAGSIKARGGFYEVFYHAERVIGNELNPRSVALKRELSNHEIVVASTGNLGLSVGLLGRALGFAVTVVMSRDAKRWKKDLLRARGARVEESQGDYSSAVSRARSMCDASSSDREPDAGQSVRYFIDDERSPHLFLGYACAAGELLEQLGYLGLGSAGVRVYLPCGVGGAPGGIAWALRLLAGERVDSVFCEPVAAPCVLLALLERRRAMQEKREPVLCPHVRTIGLSSKSAADGLAVGAASPLAVECVDRLVSGVVTLSDEDMVADALELWHAYGRRIEPSAAASYTAFKALECEADVHVLWFTGGGLLPDDEFERFTG
ncbi:MAG: D-serine ammonia-lyase [Spirochaetales bacterium]